MSVCRPSLQSWALRAGSILGSCLWAAIAIGPGAGAEKKAASAAPGAVKLVWSSSGSADVYLNGKPLRDAKPDFTTRSDELIEYTAQTPLKVGDVITVGARRGKTDPGFRLAAFDHKNRLVWQSETSHWHAYNVRDPKHWYMPATATRSKLLPATAAPKGLAHLDQFEKPVADVADTIWFQEADVVFLYCKITERRNYVRLPLREMNKYGKVKYWANEAQLDGLRPDDLDGSNRVKHYKAQPLNYKLVFSEPVEVHGVLVTMTSSNSLFTWQISCADEPKDLAEKKGTYRRIVEPQTSRADQAVDRFFKPAKASYWQLTVKDEAGEGPIALRKFEVLVPAD